MIIINNEELLRIPCQEASPDEVGGIIELLEHELNSSNKLGRLGVGLAAIQIGIPKNVAIVRLGKIGQRELNIDLVNCKIEHAYDYTMFKDEGCLSFPGLVENTMRAQEIHVVNNLVYPHSFIATGLLAVVCQHELDHLTGILLPDRAIRKNPLLQTSIGRNDLCVCGSNRKYKKCCGKNI